MEFEIEKITYKIFNGIVQTILFDLNSETIDKILIFDEVRRINVSIYYKDGTKEVLYKPLHCKFESIPELLEKWENISNYEYKDNDQSIKYYKYNYNDRDIEISCDYRNFIRIFKDSNIVQILDGATKNIIEKYYITPSGVFNIIFDNDLSSYGNFIFNKITFFPFNLLNLTTNGYYPTLNTIKEELKDFNRIEIYCNKSISSLQYNTISNIPYLFDYNVAGEEFIFKKYENEILGKNSDTNKFFFDFYNPNNKDFKFSFSRVYTNKISNNDSTVQKIVCTFVPNLTYI